MKRVKKITLVFENCELLTFPAKMFDVFSLENIETSVSTIASNCIAEMEIAKNIVFKGNNQLSKHIEQISKIPYNEQGEDNCLFVIEGDDYNKNRLTEFSDITSIECHFEDETKNMFYVNWGDDEYSNPYQISYLIESDEKQFSDLNGTWVSIHKDPIQREQNLFERMFYSIVFSKYCQIDTTGICLRTSFEETPKEIIDQVKTLLKDNFSISFENI